MSEAPPLREPRTGADSAPRIPRDVWAISITSLFSDWGYEMLLPILPFFLVFTLLTSPLVVGLIDGLAQLGQSVTSEVSGTRWAQRDGRRSIASAGYATTTVGHGLIALATLWPLVLILRVAAWTGRGSRMPIKGAMLANATARHLQGRTFGLEQALDSVGAVLGTVTAVVVLVWVGSDYTAGFRTIFAISVIPSSVAVALMLFVVRDRARATVPEAGGGLPPRRLPNQVRWFLASEALFGLGYFSILLALLQVGENLLPASGGSITVIVLAALVLYLLYNLVFTVISYPVGRWADRSPGVGLVALAFALFAGVDLLLVLSEGYSGTTLAFVVGVGAFLVAGFQVGIQGVAESSWIARQVPPEQAGRAFGRLRAIQGVTILAGSLLAGGLWTYLAPEIAFETSAAICLAATALVILAVRSTERPVLATFDVTA